MSWDWSQAGGTSLLQYVRAASTPRKLTGQQAQSPQSRLTWCGRNSIDSRRLGPRSSCGHVSTESLRFHALEERIY